MRNLGSIAVRVRAVVGMIVMCFSASAGGPSDPPERSYSVRLLDSALIGEAHAVVREHWVSYDVRNKQNARMRVVYAVTILDEEAREESKIGIVYGHYIKIENLDGRLFDAEGKEIRDLEKGDLHDFSYVTGPNLADDWRGRTAEMYADQFPYTVEFSYDLSDDAQLGWPGWVAQGDEYPVEHSYFEITLTKGENLRYWTNVDSIKPRITDENGRKTYIWEAMNLPEMSQDLQAESIEYRTCVVETAPSTFELDGYAGDVTSWQAFGQWFGQLLAGRDQLPASAIADVDRLVLPNDNPRTRVEKLYRYMQSKTRYVSIQLGIGGWQPFDATFVHDRGYGDCKALSNYMVALLKEAGVTAYPVLIRADDLDGLYRADFPSNQFNHVIVCVPFDRDSVWLECTSQIAPPGHLGDFTENRFGLLIGPQGGSLVWTPKTKPADNEQQRVAIGRLVSNGMLSADVTTVFSGDQQDQPRGALTDKSDEEKQKWLVNHIGVPNASLQRYNVDGIGGSIPRVDITMNILVPKYGTASGSRIMFQPNLMERRTYVPRENPGRKSPLRFNYPYRDKDSIIYYLPREYTVEALPAPMDLKCSFGLFNAKTTLVGDSIIVYTRILEMQKTEIPATAYGEYRKFSQDIVKADRSQAVLVKR